MTSRREFIQGTAAVVATAPLAGTAADRKALPARPIPGTSEALPVIGRGNSNAFRQGDADASWQVLRIFQEHGARYVDVGGSSRFTVAEVAREHGLVDLFYGAYFSGGDEARSGDEARLMLEVTGQPAIDLMHGYPEDAVPHWDAFRRWKDEGLARYIGVARHRREYFETMMELMRTKTVDFVQVNYSPLETDAGERILPLAQDLGVAVTINRPFLNGEYFDLVRGRELPGWAAEFDCHSWAQFSLKFILGHPAVNCVLTETANPQHARDNLGAGFGRLPDVAERRRMVELLRGFAG